MYTLMMIAFRNLLQHRRRTLMLGGAIAGVTALLVILSCLSTGVRDTVIRSATTVSTGHINVAGFYKVTAGQSAPLVTDYAKVIETVRATLGSDLDFVTPRGRGWARLVSDEASMQVGIAGLELAGEPRLGGVLKVEEGKLEDLANPGSILIFKEQAKKLKVKVGDSMVFSVLDASGVNNTVDVRVVAIAADMGLMSSWSVFVPQATLRQLYSLNENATGAVLVYLKDMKKIPQAMDKLRTALKEQGHIVMDHDSKAFWMKFQELNREDWTGQKLDLTTWEDEVSFAIWALKAIDGISYLLTMVLLVIIAVGIMNTMWIAIRERTREIGTLRAIGMQRRRVLAMFTFEAFFLGAMGTSAGAAIGLGVAALLNLAKLPVPEGATFFLMSNVLHLTLDVPRVMGNAAFITACVTIVALIPSLKAARMRPVTAMSHVG